jgi:hypothetical protein
MSIDEKALKIIEDQLSDDSKTGEFISYREIIEAYEAAKAKSVMGGASPQLTDAMLDALEVRGSVARAMEETPPATDRPAEPTELNPCPFCGGQPKVIDGRGRMWPPFQVKCVGRIGGQPCKAEVWPSNTRQQAIDAWNSRSPATQQPFDEKVMQEALTLMLDDYGNERNWQKLRGYEMASIAAKHYSPYLRQTAPVSLKKCINAMAKVDRDDVGSSLPDAEYAPYAKVVLDAAGVDYVG